jgi:hypothetical protein
MKNAVSSYRLSVEALSFFGVLAMAIYSQWSAKDLLWGLWISSLSIGYLTLLAGFLGHILQGRLMNGQAEHAEDCVFRRSRPPVPDEVDHPFRMISATCSD